MIAYSEEFFIHQAPGSSRSAQAIVPALVELVRPRSVVDVGCGVGTWLECFAQHGVTDVFGVDGDHVRRSQLRIAEREFEGIDLAKPFRMRRRFDLVLCLEVAEHLPPQSAPDIVESLVRLGDVIAFSAAIPHQGGILHLNEQWPAYWSELFARLGFASIDCLRDRFWDDPRVDTWYAQNLIFYVRHDRIEDFSPLAEHYDPSRPHPRARVHPMFYNRAINELARIAELDRIPRLPWAWRALWLSLAASIKHHIRSLILSRIQLRGGR
jgi:SAM-dependent methyltransferase